MGNSPNRTTDTTIRSKSELLSDWKCWSVAALGLLSLALLFQPWLSASGPSGEVHTDAFGRFDGSVPGLATGERPVDGIASISGWWGALTATATLITLAGLLLYRVFGIGLRAVIAASVANAVFGPATLLYLNGKAPELRAMTEYRDGLKAAFDAALNSFLGGGTAPDTGTKEQVATVALTNQGILGSIAAAATAVFALGLRNRIHSAVGVAVAPGATELRHAVVEPATGTPSAPHEADDLLRRQLEQLTRYEHRLRDRNEPVGNARQLSDGADTQRLLRRAERPDRAEGQPGQVRRERIAVRRTPPRPGKRASCTPQPGTRVAAARGGRSAARSGSSATARRERVQR